MQLKTNEFFFYFLRSLSRIRMQPYHYATNIINVMSLSPFGNEKKNIEVVIIGR